jgi:hypothetical protein
MRAIVLQTSCCESHLLDESIRAATLQKLKKSQKWARS